MSQEVRFKKQTKQDTESIVKDFDWNRVSWQDKEYLSGMIHETINSRNFRAKGRSFEDLYPDHGDYALFNCPKTAVRYSDEFYNTGTVVSHLLHPHPRGRKYYFVWSY